MAMRPCMAATEASWKTPVHVAGGVDAGHVVRETRSTTMCPDSATATPHCSRLSPAVFGTVPTVISACEPSTVRPSVSSTTTPFSVRVTLAARPRSAIRPPRDGEDLLDDGGGVGVLAGQHLVAGGDEGDRHAGLEVAGGELGAGHAGADDDEVLGHLREVVDVAPVEDPLAVGLGARQHARVGAGGDEDDVGLQRLGAAPSASSTSTRCSARPRISSESRPVPGDDPDALAQQPLADVGGLGHRQALDPVVDRGEVEVDGGQLRALEAEGGRVADRRHGAGGGDEGLRGHAVGEHAGATEPSRSMTVTSAPSCAATSAAS